MFVLPKVEVKEKKKYAKQRTSLMICIIAARGRVIIFFLGGVGVVNGFLSHGERCKSERDCLLFE